MADAFSALLAASPASASPDYLQAALAARNASPARNLAGSDPAKAAADFETFFLSQVLETIQSGPSLESAFGGGPGESAFKSFLSEAYAKAIQRAGGIGLADRLKADIIALQAQQTALETQPQETT
jgi:Rod binding domain-containing protein